MPRPPLRPAPPPDQVNLRLFVMIGTAVFLVAAALIAALPSLRNLDDGLWLWTAISGAALGLLGMVVMRWQRAP